MGTKKIIYTYEQGEEVEVEIMPQQKPHLGFIRCQVVPGHEEIVVEISKLKIAKDHETKKSTNPI